MNILLVEDDNKQRQLLRRFIEKNYIDNRVYFTGSMNEALTISKETDIDLFFVDIRLEDGSGLNLSNELRNVGEYKNTPIVFMTTESHMVLEAINKIHCYSFLVKPFKMSEVKSIIDKFSNQVVNEVDDNSTIIKVDNSLSINIKYKDIFFIEYSFRKCELHTKKAIYSIKNKTLSSFIEELGSKDIIQTHKSYAVNLKNVASIEREYYKCWNIYFNGYNKTAKLGYKFKDLINNEEKIDE